MIGSKVLPRRLFANKSYFKIFQTRYHSTAKVFVNKDTRVICQGLTGKHVNFHSCFLIFREHSTRSKHLTMELIWLEESHQKKLEQSI